MTHVNALIEVSALVGFLLPHVIAVVNQQHWRSGLRSVVAFVACLAAGLVTTWAKGGITWQNWFESAAVVWTVAQASYHGLWKPTGTTTAIEENTSPKQ